VLEVEVDGGNCIILARTPGGLPYAIWGNDLFISMAERNPGQIVYHDEGAPFWSLAPDPLGFSQFRFGYEFDEDAPEITYDLEGDLQLILDRGRMIEYDEERNAFLISPAE